MSVWIWPKTHHFCVRPESRQREPNQTNETQIFDLSCLYSGKWSNIAAKVCESLGLAVHLEVNLESICAGVFSVSAMTITCQYVTCFIQRTGILRSHVCGSESCHEQGRLLRTSEKELMLLARKLYKTISKEFGLYKSTGRQIVYKWRKFKTTVPSREVVG